MPAFSDLKFTTAQILGGCTIVLSLMMGILGSIFLKHDILLPEYMTCLRNTGWSLLIISIVWTGLATRQQLSR